MSIGSSAWVWRGDGLILWTYDHLRAATDTSPSETTAILALMNLIISGYLPAVPSLHAFALTALAKPRGLRRASYRYQRGVGSPSKPLRDGRLPARSSVPRSFTQG
jgi:hypothetical protein